MSAHRELLNDDKIKVEEESTSSKVKNPLTVLAAKFILAYVKV